jgi:hypothetical protein
MAIGPVTERNHAMKKAKTERRKHKRFSTRKAAFAVIGPEKAYLDEIKKMSMGEIACAVYKSNPVKMGQIIDMSRGGLAFSYIAGKKLAGKAVAVDILSAGNKFFLEKILFKTIMDVDAGEDFEIDPIQLKHQRIQFVDLSPDQKEKLEYFLSHCTTCKMAN